MHTSLKLTILSFMLQWTTLVAAKNKQPKENPKETSQENNEIENDVKTTPQKTEAIYPRGLRWFLALRLGQVTFSGNRAYTKYNEHLLNNNDTLIGTAWSLRSTFHFNDSNPIGVPVFGLNVGLVNYFAEESASYSDFETFKVGVNGSFSEISFRVGIHPYFRQLLIYGEVGTGLQFFEVVTVRTRMGKETYYDHTRILPFTIGGGLHVNPIYGFVLDVNYTYEFTLHDHFILGGIGYGL